MTPDETVKGACLASQAAIDQALIWISALRGRWREENRA
jgi:hypothetical protein